ncbi:amidohydrolase family protein [Pseudomonas citronellolis]|uniref:amidohydrolase family protein n=1 Tax=Pseudomonas citronellolis TaxID=53408 RepID=UPI0008530393|nr:amidohydrolase family protein [Pseudomonas humi]
MSDEWALPKIDLHSHWFAPSTVRLLGGRRTGVRMDGVAEGRPVLLRGVRDGLPERFELGPQWFDLEVRLAHLETVGIVHQLLSWPTTLGLDPLSAPGELLGLWQAYNDDLGQLLRAHPRRFSALAALSTSDIAWSGRELARAHQELGLIGAVLPVGAFASRQAALHLRPLLEEGQRQRSHLYLHTGLAHASVPGQPPLPADPDLPGIRSALATAAVFANAVFTLLYTDVLDDYPDLTVQVAMLGGSGIFANLLEQFLAAPQRYDNTDVARRLERLSFDTGAAGSGSGAISQVARLIGSRYLVFGTDYAPLADTAAVIGNLLHAELDVAERRAIFFDNPARLLRSKGVSLPTPVTLNEA